ncbi:hypothetical protein BJV77DRAFT_158988 [Russula vinacea]|nr:hypothetical protein BJV77DRAFT_158988 [Russula vinacea]
MAQLLSILALSTKAVTNGRIKKILKKLVGRTEVEDALSRLNMLTKEESLMVMVRNLEVAHHIDGVVHDIDINVKGTWKGIEGVARGVDNVAHEIKRLSRPVTLVVDH